MVNELKIEFLCSNNNTDDDVWNLLSNADLFVTASTWEGYGRPVMEAQALGIPTVCFDTGAHRDNMEHGQVIKNGDFKAFKKAVKYWGVLQLSLIPF